MEHEKCLNCGTDFITFGLADNFCSEVCAKDFLADLDFGERDDLRLEFIIVLELHI